MDDISDTYEVYDKLFTKPRNIPDTRTVIQINRSLKSQVDHAIGYFLEDNMLPLCDVEKIRKLCPSQILAELQGKSVSPQMRTPDTKRGYLDDRSNKPYLGKSYREYSNPLTARDLYDYLQEQRVNHPELPDADRRIIYIEALDGAYIYALAETATSHQAEALIDAIAAYLNFDTMFSLSVPPSLHIYRISMHLTYPVLVMSNCSNMRPNHLPWLYSGFTQIHETEEDQAYPLGTYTARSTIEICGTGYSNYTVWAFADALHTEEPLYEKDEESFPYNSPDAQSTELHIDPIVSGGWLDANKAIMDVRLYGARILLSQINKALKHWKDVIRSYRSSFEEYEDFVNALTEDIAAKSGRRRNQRVKQAYERTRNWRELISKHYDSLSRLVTAVELFCARDGDILFFARVPTLESDHARAGIRARTHATTISIRRLKNLQRTLELWSQTCNRLNDYLDLNIKLEGNERSIYSTQTTLWTFMIITPGMLGIGVCSMNKDAIPFALSSTSLPITIIAIFGFLVALRLTAFAAWECLDCWREAQLKQGNRFTQRGLAAVLLRYFESVRFAFRDSLRNGRDQQMRLESEI